MCVGGLVRSGGCITSKALSLPTRNIVECLLHPSDLLLLLSIAAQVGKRVEGEPIHR